MPEPSFLSWGTTPHRSDTDWTEAQRWLGALQNRPCADPRNNGRRTDSYNRILYKIAASIAGCLPVPPTPPTPTCDAAIIVGTGRSSGDTNGFLLNAMAANGSDAVAVGNGTGGLGQILYSTDGASWSAATPPGYFLYSVTYGNGAWIAVGELSVIFRSTDMMAWDYVSFPSVPTSDNMYGVAFGAGCFIAPDAAGRIYRSTDGITWALITTLTGEALNSIAFGSGLFVIVGEGGFVTTSPDGLVWTERTSGAVADLIDVAYNGSRFVAISGATATVIYSDNGTTWQSTAISSSDSGIHAVAGGDGIFATVTQETGQVWVSADGADWTRQTPDLCPDVHMIDYYGNCQFNVSLPYFPGEGCTGVYATKDAGAPSYVNDYAVNDGFAVEVGFLAPSAAGYIRTSSNGICWTARTNPGPALPANSRLWAAAYGNGIYMAVGGDTLVITSPDGIVWTLQPPLGDPVVPGVHRTLVSAVTFGLGVFVAVVVWDDLGPNHSDFYTSTDGVAWTLRQSIAHAGTESIDNVNFANGIFIALGGNNDLIYTSPDGIVWTQRTAPTSGQVFQESAYGNGVWIVTMDASNVPPDYFDYVLRSTDNGVTWSLVQIPDQVYSISYGNGYFVLEEDGGGDIYTSPDGLTWTLTTLGPGNRMVQYYKDCTFII